MTCFKNLGCLQIPTNVISALGQTGATGTISVGTVSTGAAGSSVIITNVGTATAAILDFTIPEGDAGATGANGTTRLYYNTTPSTNASTSSWQTLKTYTLPADTLDTNGDSLFISARSTQDAAIPIGLTKPFRRVTFGTVSCTLNGTDPLGEPFAASATVVTNSRLKLNVEFIRLTDATALCRVCYNSESGVVTDEIQYEITITGLDFTTTNDIDLDTYQITGSETNLRSLTIDLIKI